MTSKTQKSKDSAATEPKLDTYTVVGMFPWDERHSEALQAESAEQAEFLFSDEANRIAGVLAGAHEVDPKRAHESPVAYSVLAYYRDNGQRYGASVHACSVAEAEEMAVQVCNEDNGYGRVSADGYEQEFDSEIIVICGTVEGDLQCADIYAGGEGSVFERGDIEGERYEAWRREQDDDSDATG